MWKRTVSAQFVSGDLLKTKQKLNLSTKFPHQKINVKKSKYIALFVVSGFID